MSLSRLFKTLPCILAIRRRFSSLGWSLSWTGREMDAVADLVANSLRLILPVYLLMNLQQGTFPQVIVDRLSFEQLASV